MAVLFPLAWVIRVASRPTVAFTRNPNGIGGGFTLENFASAWREGSWALPPPHLYTVPLGGSGHRRRCLRRLRLRQATCAVSPVPARLCHFGHRHPVPSIIIPLFNEGLDVGYTNNYIGLSIVFAALYGSWDTFFLYGQYKSVPDALIDSAHIDGARELRISSG